MLDCPGGFNLITPENQRGFPGFGQKNEAEGKNGQRNAGWLVLKTGEGKHSHGMSMPLGAGKGKANVLPDPPTPKERLSPPLTSDL